MSRPLPDLRDVAYWVIFLTFSVIATYILVTLTQMASEADESVPVEQTAAILSRRSAERVVLSTSAGEIALSLDRKASPKRVARVIALAQDGGFDGVPFRVDRGIACAGLEDDDAMGRATLARGAVSTGEDGGAICITLIDDADAAPEGFVQIGTAQNIPESMSADEDNGPVIDLIRATAE